MYKNIKNISPFIREVEENKYIHGYAGPVYSNRREYRPWIKIIFWSVFSYFVSKALWITLLNPPM